MSRKINQYSLQGKFIKTWGSAAYIQKEFGYDASHITKCCSKKVGSPYKFQWRYTEDNILELDSVNFNHCKPVVVYNKWYEPIIEYQTMQEAQENIGLNLGTIRKRCKTPLGEQKKEPYLQFKN